MPDEFGIDDLAAAPGKTTAWFGVRNFQARNFMLKEMRIGDQVFFLSLELSGAGIAASQRSHRRRIPMQASSIEKAPTSTPKRSASRPAGSTSTCASSARPGWSAWRSCAAPRALQDAHSRSRNRLSITPVSADEGEFITRRLMKL